MLPRRHSAHVPQGMAAMTWTRSPGCPALDAVADLDHLAGDLVPHHPRRHDVLVAEPGDLHVGAAGRAVADPDLDVAGTRRRLGCVLDADVSRRVEPRDLHGARHVLCLFLGRLQHVQHVFRSVASRSACAWSGSISTCASWASTST